MEHRTKFDLDQNVAHWKTSLFKSQKMANENIEELSDHLYSEIDTLREIGLDEEEAFLVARKRIGSVESIAAEFKKVNRQILFIHEITPYVKGILIYIAFSLFLNVFGNLSLLIGIRIGIDVSTVNTITFSILSLGILSLSYLLYDRFKKQYTIIPINISLLSIIIVTVSVLNPISSTALLKLTSLKGIGMVFSSIAIFKFSCIALLLVLSCFAIIYIKKERLKIAN